MSKDIRDQISIRFYKDHVGLNITNSTKHFIYPDSRERFYKNLETQGLNWHYKNTAENFPYDIDQYGFRNNHSLSEVTNSQYIATVGCSHTMGIGISYEETYSHQIERTTGIPVINLGLGGSSNEISFFNIMWLLSNFNRPKVIVFQRTGISRFPIKDGEHRLYFAGPWVGTWSDEYKDLEKFIEISDRFGYNQIKQKMIARATKDLLDKIELLS